MAKDLRVERGRAAEALAERYLVANGCRVLGRNVRYRRGELDLIVLDGVTVVFVEVRARRGSSAFDPAATIGRAKKEALLRAGARWLADHRLGDAPCRFDLVAVRTGPDGSRLRHIRGAFVDEGAPRERT